MNNYSALQKTLHKISLSPHFMREISFDIEKMLFLKKCGNTKTGPHIFVTGLARSGTTIILNALHETGNFASLTYEDMPFILSPNLWSKLSFLNKHMEAQERAHGDGIMVSTNSPEAFEEVFWTTFEQEDNLEELFRNYVSLILLKNNKNRYLSKNNQNIRRIGKIQDIFPNAQILVPFRDPLQHSFSLLNQNRKFSQEQSSEPFVRQYMHWIGHSEFGLDYKPIIERDLKHTDTNNLNHWLEQWLMLYQSTYNDFGSGQPNIHFICYEGLCHGTRLQDHMNNILGITLNPEFEFRESRKKIEEGYDSTLLENCMILYKKLASLQRKS